MPVCSAGVVVLILLAAPSPPTWAATPAPPANPPELNLELVTIDAAPGACPSASEVTEALTVRLPQLTIGASDPAGPDRTAVRLTLTHGHAGTLRVELVDPRGAVALERTLAVLTHDSPARRSDRRNSWGCAALADTVSLIVDRYLRHLGYRDDSSAQTEMAALSTEIVPTRETAPSTGVPAVLLGAGADLSAAARQAGGGSAWTEYATLSFALHWQRLAVTASAGLGTSTQIGAIPETDAGTFKVMPVPVRLSAGLRLPWRGTVLIPQVGTGVDLLFTSSRHVRGGHFELAADPIGEAGGEYLVPLGGRAFVNAHAWGVLNLRPHDFWVTGLATPVYRMPRWYARAGLQLGLLLDVGDAHVRR